MQKKPLILRTKKRIKLKLAAILVMGLSSNIALAAVVNYNLAADWSDASNPNGVWSYEVAGVPGTSGIRIDATIATAPPIWGSGGNTFEGWSQSNGTETSAYDWSVGNVFGHTPMNGSISIAWTSPDGGTINFSGGIWEGRDIGRSNNWDLMLNSSTLASGVIASGDSFDSSNPLLLAGSGISVSAGDVLRLKFIAIGVGDYVVADLGIQLTTPDAGVPEPVTLALLGLGMAGLGFSRRKKA